MIMAQDDIQFWQAGDWTMVYLNGELVVHGDHYHADEWLQERCGVVVVYDDHSASLPDGRNPVHLLAEAEENMRAAEDVAGLAKIKRQEAQRLLAEADALEGKK